MQAHSGLCFTWLIHSTYQTHFLFYFIEGEGDELNKASSQQQNQQSYIPISQDSQL